ncbi:uncharacterized protein LOC129755975 isoform X2 [Uranotaenia lowii]|uniref:uncharacterized protein LOC129755975 isoform X2 n=1 Tax=Uranotaenia lowii TaxID=190385 RepID=UPI00247ABC76|nr:uncharacterized protein LOC129755975 isoform X2 [Uranotaenia lowii]
MEKAFRRYVHFEIAAVGVLLLFRSLLILYLNLEDPAASEAEAVDLWNYIGDFRGFWFVAIPGELLYVLAVLSLFYGMYRKDERFCYPLLVAGFVDFSLLVFGEICIIFYDEYIHWKTIWFLEPNMLMPIMYELIHCIMTIIALSRLYTKERHARKQFVRFRVKDEDEAGGLIINSDDRRD